MTNPNYIPEYFSKLKILDLSTVLAGPQVGTFFAELGARVIKFENAKTNGDAGTISALVTEHLGFDLKKSEAEALIAILHKENVVEWNHQLEKPEGLLGQFAGNHTGIGWTGTTHTSDPTLLSAIGPQSSRFSGIIRNSDVFGHLMELLG